MEEEKDSNKNLVDIIRKLSESIILYSKNLLILVGLFILVIGVSSMRFWDFQPVIEHLDLTPFKILFLKIISHLCVVIGTSCFGIGIINISYKQWRDKVEVAKNKIFDDAIKELPNQIANELLASIESIATQTAGKLYPVVPSYIYPKQDTPGNKLREDLIESLKKSNNFYYSGISMGVAKKCIDVICDESLWLRNNINMTFIIPHPDLYGQENGERENIRSNAQKIVKRCMECSRKEFNINFIFLHFEPSFHVHLTDDECWFAFVDRGQGDIVDGQRTNKCDYPTTYLYKNYNKNKDTEMYDTINTIIKDLGNHFYVKYTLSFGGGIEFRNECYKAKKVPKKSQVIIENIFKEFQGCN